MEIKYMSIFNVQYTDKSFHTKSLNEDKACYVLAVDFTDVERIFENKYPKNEIINIYKITTEVLYEQ